MGSSGKAGRVAGLGGHRWRPSGVRRLVPLAVLACGLVAFFALGLDDYVSFSVLRDRRQALMAFVADNGLAAGLIYTALYALAVAFSIPGASVLTVAGGFLFGTLWASAMVVVGATVGAVAVFLAARTAFGDVLRRRAGGWVARLEAGFRENAFSYMLTLRLIPAVPFWLVNLAPALLGVPLGVFALTTFVGIIPGTVVYAGVGNGLGATLEAGTSPDLGVVFRPEVILPLVGLAALSLLPVAYKRIRGRRPAAPDME
ncbi:MAG TPA: TVP38/TMEM64 family protein [Alphaproteobacteria bacterium]|nr:TVP38/TMEM64 family protein [Alphaproteobacteria bacterium]